MTRMYKMSRIFGLFSLALLVGACTVLPYGDDRVVCKWESFEQAMRAYEQVEPFRTDLEALGRLGFTPESQANVRILNRAEVVERLVADAGRDRSGLPSGLRQCLASSDNCYAHEIRLRVTEDQRYGNVLADLFNFQRKVETRGWEFNAVVVLVADLVVYKTWSGTPVIHQQSQRVNPLGPLQGIGPAITPKPKL